jgi:RNA polymerase sigma-70 factor (subfamily 1)
MSVPTDAVNRALGEYRAYLETLTWIHIDRRLQGELSMSDIIQNTLLEAWRDLDRIERLDDKGRRALLRRMLVNNLIDEINRIKPRTCKTVHLDAAVEESSCRLIDWLAAEDTPAVEGLIREEERLRLLAALSKLDPQQREALILQRFHHYKLAQIAEHLGCTIGAVAGLHARGLKNLRYILNGDREKP